MKFTLGRKLFLYTGGLLIAVLLIAFAVLEHNQERQWSEYLHVQQIAFARFATPELLKHFRGNFSEATGPEHREQLAGLLSFNPDLVKFSLYSISGRLLFDPPSQGSNQLLPEHSTDISWAAAALGPVSRTLQLADGSQMLEIVAPAFGPSGGKVLNVRYLFSFASVEQRLLEMRNTFVTIALVAVSCALLLVALVARSFTRPIQRLTAGVKAVSRGELQTSIASRGRDELATLALAFNEMASSLEQNHTDLEAKNLELQQVNAELQQIHERLIRTERLAAVGQLAAGVSHEIDNPVGIILGYAELLLEDCRDDQQKADDLRAIIAECQRCRKITGGLLGLVRVSEQQRELIDIESLVKETINSLLPQKMFQNIVIELPETQPLPPFYGDADRIRQVLVNLLLNSAQALQGSGAIWVQFAQDGDRLLLEIHDNGPGIATEHYEQIFEPFFSTKGRSEGTGLGLSICRKLVEEHGGEILAEKSPHGGALLRVSLSTANSS